MDQPQPSPAIPQPAPVNQPQQPVKRSPYLIRIFQGRMNRQNYSVGSLLITIVPLVCFLAFTATLAISPAAGLLLFNPYDTNQLQNAALQDSNLQSTLNEILTSPFNIFIAVIFVLSLVLTFPFVVAFQVRRLHDMNINGWLVLLNFIPIISYIFPLFVALASGTNGENKYGPKPSPRTHIKHDIFLLG